MHPAPAHPTTHDASITADAIIIGGGQSALATAYYLRRAGLNYLILDNQPGPGAAWRHVWPSMTLFSTAEFSNLPGWPMPHYPGFPPASHVVDYLTRYEQRYDLPILRPVHVTRVDFNQLGTKNQPDPHNQDNNATPRFTVHSKDGQAFHANHVVATTGTWSAPFVPFIPGSFAGTQWHSANYPGAAEFASASAQHNTAHTGVRKVAVVGAANSGAQIAAELLLAGIDTTWFTRHEPRYMPDDVDGRVLFYRNSQRALAILRGAPDPGADSALGDIVVLPPVKQARDAGLLNATAMFTHFDELNSAGFTDIIWCTGFRPAFQPIRHLLCDGKPTVPGLHLVGYGDIVGPGAATITGVGPHAKAAAQDIIRSYR